MALSLKTLPLPDDPTLAAWASALNRAGYWAWLIDDQWRHAWLTDDLRLSYGDTRDSPTQLIGTHYFSERAVRFRVSHVRGPEATRNLLRRDS